MFEVNGTYANRKGEYTVLELTPPKMRVRYDDGTEAELKIDVQDRIWQNIAAEYEARASSKASRRKSADGTGHFIKVVSISADEDLTFAGWGERVVMGPIKNPDITVKAGDRIIMYALENRCFFAVATVTGDPKEANPKDLFFINVDLEVASFFPIDIDAQVSVIENGVDVDSVELESQPKFKRMRLESEIFMTINEDDFELLAEALTEVSEDEDFDEDLIEEEEFEEEEE